MSTKESGVLNESCSLRSAPAWILCESTEDSTPWPCTRRGRKGSDDTHDPCNLHADRSIAHICLLAALPTTVLLAAIGHIRRCKLPPPRCKSMVHVTHNDSSNAPLFAAGALIAHHYLDRHVLPPICMALIMHQLPRPIMEAMTRVCWKRSLHAAKLSLHPSASYRPAMRP